MNKHELYDYMKRCGIVVVKLVVGQTRKLTDHEKLTYYNTLISMFKYQKELVEKRMIASD